MTRWRAWETFASAPGVADARHAFLIALAATACVLVQPSLAMAQAINLDLGSGGGLTDRVVQLVALLTVLSLAPSIVMMTTSFVRIVVVLSLLRQAMGLQQSPPNSGAGQPGAVPHCDHHGADLHPVLQRRNTSAPEPHHGAARRLPGERGAR